MHKWRQRLAWTEAHPKVWLDLVRIYIGLGLFVRGVLLITNQGGDFVSAAITRTGESWLLSAALLHYVSLAHLIGGAMLIFGILTRIGALVQLPILAGAVLFVHRGEGLMAAGQSFEFAALVLFLLTVVAIAGPGPVSVDGESRPPAPAPAPHDENLDGIH
ncbi:MAG: DoxX family protein [Opitutus sp.]|nr:DoxX family protein [Opitutus sp.]